MRGPSGRAALILILLGPLPASAARDTGPDEAAFQAAAARPEWFTVDENTLYRVVDGEGHEMVRSGSELRDGIEVAAPGRWTVARWRPEP